MWYDLLLDCCPASCSGYPTCAAGSAQLKAFRLLREQHIEKWAPLVNKSGNGAWAPACITHTMTQSKWTNDEWEVPQGSGNTLSRAVQRWLSGAEPSRSVDTVAWPANRACSTSD